MCVSECVCVCHCVRACVCVCEMHYLQIVLMSKFGCCCCFLILNAMF